MRGKQADKLIQTGKYTSEQINSHQTSRAARNSETYTKTIRQGPRKEEKEEMPAEGCEDPCECGVVGRQGTWHAESERIRQVQGWRLSSQGRNVVRRKKQVSRQRGRQVGKQKSV